MQAADSANVTTHSSVIDAFGGPAGYAAAVGIADSHARAMKARDSISPAYWRRTASAAAERALAGVTFTRLAEIAAEAAEARLIENEKAAGIAAR